MERAVISPPFFLQNRGLIFGSVLGHYSLKAFILKGFSVLSFGFKSRRLNQKYGFYA